jgi:hypothetical protein
MDAFSVLDSRRGTAGARELAVRDSNRWTATRHWLNSPLPPACSGEHIHCIEPTCALGAVHHQPYPLENLQVLRNRGTGHVHPLGNFPHRAGTTTQTLEHRPSGRISKCIENLLYVSFH